jgi:hypothetical protein
MRFWNLFWNEYSFKELGLFDSVSILQRRPRIFIEVYRRFFFNSANQTKFFRLPKNKDGCPLVLTFYSTRLALQKFYLEKNLSSEFSRVKFKNGIHSTRSSFQCFVSSKFRVLVEYFWRSIVIFMHLQKMFCPTKWWYAKCSFDNK